MAKSPEVRNLAIIGTGVIGASWAALYLARGYIGSSSGVR
jgi:glycine/D-amino acid oxidase-like deaminating enzyme